jgi:hypothetical protein
VKGVCDQERQSVDREVQQLRVEWHRVNGKDYVRRRNCDTADGSNGVTVNCISVRASGINSLDPIRREFICRVHTQHVTIFSIYTRRSTAVDISQRLDKLWQPGILKNQKDSFPCILQNSRIISIG